MLKCPQAQTVFIIILKGYLFHCVDIYIDGTNTVVNKTAGGLVQIKVVDLNCTSSHRVKAVPLNSVPFETNKQIIFTLNP